MIAGIVVSPRCINASILPWPQTRSNDLPSAVGSDRRETVIGRFRPTARILVTISSHFLRFRLRGFVTRISEMGMLTISCCFMRHLGPISDGRDLRRSSGCQTDRHPRPRNCYGRVVAACQEDHLME